MCAGDLEGRGRARNVGHHRRRAAGDQVEKQVLGDLRQIAERGEQAERDARLVGGLQLQRPLAPVISLLSGCSTPTGSRTPIDAEPVAEIGYLPKVAQDLLLNLIASRSTAVMTNVPGPASTLKVAGSTLKQSLFWVPQTGVVGMGVSIFSYAGKVQFGLITDAALTPDPEAVVSRFPEEFEKYLYYVLLDPPAAEEKVAPAPAARVKTAGKRR